MLTRADPLDVPTTPRIGRGTVHKMRQNLAWVIGYNTLVLPIAAGVFEPALALVLRPEIAALSMSASGFIGAMNALALKGLSCAPCKIAVADAIGKAMACLPKTLSKEAAASSRPASPVRRGRRPRRRRRTKTET